MKVLIKIKQKTFIRQIYDKFGIMRSRNEKQVSHKTFDLVVTQLNGKIIKSRRKQK